MYKFCIILLFVGCASHKIVKPDFGKIIFSPFVYVDEVQLIEFKDQTVKIDSVQYNLYYRHVGEYGQIIRYLVLNSDISNSLQTQYIIHYPGIWEVEIVVWKNNQRFSKFVKFMVVSEGLIDEEKKKTI